MAITVLELPEALPLSLELLKEHLRIIGDDDDATLANLYLPSAVEIFESTTKRALITQTVCQSFDCFPALNHFLLERAPLGELIAVRYYDRDEQLQTLSPDRYSVIEGRPAIVQLKRGASWPSDLHPSRLGAVEVEFTCGYGDDDDAIPSGIKQALSMITGDLFIHREDTIAVFGVLSVEPTWTSKRLMNRYQLYYYEHPSQRRR